MKFIRWKYVVPRLVLVAILVASVRFGLDPLLHYGIVAAGQSATGAKVELAAVETSLRNGQLELRGLQVANPQSVSRNSVEAERTTLELDVRALLQGRVVVRNGEIAGLAFDTKRAESGELEIVVEENSEPSALDPLVAKASEWASQWFDEASQRLDSDFADQLQTPKVADKLEERWKQQAAHLRARAEDLKVRGKELEDEFREVKKNPLRSMERIPQLQSQLQTVQQELAAIQQEIKALPNQAKADGQALLAAKQADEAFIKQQLRFGRLDGDNLTQIILGQPLAENTQGVLDWISWTRRRLPTNSSKELAKERSRGTVVNFGAPRPKLHVEQLGLTLIAQVAGSPMQFTGSLTNVSTEPRLLTEPARLELVASGDVPVTLEVVSDRRGETPHESLFLACPALPVGGQTMGKADKLAIELAPGVADLRVELKLEGDQLAGHIEFRQSKFQITPLSPEGRNSTLATALAAALGHINELSAEVQLAGTLEQPEIKIDSPFGKQLADGISTAMLDLASQKSEALLAKVSGRLDEQLAKLESTKNTLQQELLAKLGENQKLFESLASFSGAGGTLSVPQLGALGSGLIRK